MNKTVLTGNLTRDPEIRTFDARGKKVTVANFTIASSRRFKKADGTPDQETLFMDCEVWDSGAEVIGKWFFKGSSILVEGALKNESWGEGEDRRHKIKLRVSNFEFFSVKKNENSSGEAEAEPVAVGAEDDGKNPF